MPKGKWNKIWPDFETALKSKLRGGYQEYGDTSFKMHGTDILDELEEECLDLAGWGLILFAKIREMKRRMPS